MSLDKAIEHHKEKRQPYRGAKAIDPTCRNHGYCEWCRRNRQHKFMDKKGEDAMRTETTFYAFDDTEFDNEAECLAYEEHIKSLWDSMIFYNDKGERPENPTEHFVEHDAVYVKIVDTERAKELTDWLNSYVGVCLPDEKEFYDGAVFMWDFHDWGEWIDLTEICKMAEGVMGSINLDKLVGAS